MIQMGKAAFLDRDGVINVDKGYVHRIEDFEFMPGVLEGLRTLQALHYHLIIVTNQSGIARGFFTELDYRRLSNWMVDRLRSEGISLTAVYYCPHLPDAVIPAYRKTCRCRKPAPGMIETACAEWGIDPAASLLFGNSIRDIEAGDAAGIGRSILVNHSPSAPNLLDAVSGLSKQSR